MNRKVISLSEVDGPYEIIISINDDELELTIMDVKAVYKILNWVKNLPLNDDLLQQYCITINGHLISDVITDNNNIIDVIVELD